MEDTPVFVFGSNLQGRHGKGAALYAFHHRGAVWGKGEGHWGNSYALPTRTFTTDGRIETLSLPVIHMCADTFVKYAAANPELQFQVTRLGCGLAGYHDYEIAPFFNGVPVNVILPSAWRHYVCPCTQGRCTGPNS